MMTGGSPDRPALPAPDVSQEILTLPGITLDIFSDGFESGGTFAWSDVFF